MFQEVTFQARKNKNIRPLQNVYISGNEKPKKIIYLRKRKPRKNPYISGKGTSQYFRKQNFFIFQEKYMQNYSIFRTRSIFRTLKYLELEAYSELRHIQNLKYIQSTVKK